MTYINNVNKFKIVSRVGGKKLQPNKLFDKTGLTDTT